MLSPSAPPSRAGTQPCVQVYLIGGTRIATNSPTCADAVAWAYLQGQRPRCLCRRDGIEMYIARTASGNGSLIVKRMPETGSHHASDCPSYEPPADLSGLGQVLGTAIVEDPETGQTTLRLAFPLMKLKGRTIPPTSGGESSSASSEGTKLSLRGLLHYLWGQAELTRWHPGFAGKRSWSMVRRHLLNAADRKVAGGVPLRTRLYIPEPFTVDQRDAITARRHAHWCRAIPQPGQPAQRMLLLAEVKEIVPARYGHKAVIKHLPDQAFALDDILYRRLERRFGPELSLWGANEGLHMMGIGTFALSHAGVPTLEQLSLMLVTNQWLTVDDGFDLQLTTQLVDESRSFIKVLRYNLGKKQQLPSALLTDTKDSPIALNIERVESGSERHQQTGVDGDREEGPSNWCWYITEEQMPALPPHRCQAHKSLGQTPLAGSQWRQPA